MQRETVIDITNLVLLENQNLRKSLGELTDACAKIRESIDFFGRPPPMNAKVWPNFRGALAVAEALLGREMSDAGCL